MRTLLTGILASAMLLSTASMTFAQETETLEPQFSQTLAEAESNFSFSNGVMTFYRGRSADVVIPATINGQAVTAIGVTAFPIYEFVKTVVIPEGVTIIDDMAFYGCTSLHTVTLPKSVTTIKQGAFDVTNLKTVYYGGSEADRNNINVTSRQNTDLLNATWIYAEESATYPEWATIYTDYAEESGMMPDLTPENYNDPSNRGLIAQSFYNLFANGVELTATHEFTDVGDFGVAVAWCHGAGIMSGTGRTTFGTYGNVNREQFCLILKQMATILEKDTVSGDVSSLSEFSDSWSISDWAQEGVAWAVANGIMAGSNGALNPHGDVTRLEVAIMMKALEDL